MHLLKVVINKKEKENLTKIETIHDQSTHEKNKVFHLESPEHHALVPLPMETSVILVLHSHSNSEVAIKMRPWKPSTSNNHPPFLKKIHVS